ncbi:MAG TPA: ABC transporter permease subunit [Tepidisphaeraceae bacterium]|nr:ABC transporter permease subunit [Tepidisphaeraceae bacterium]
MISRDRTTSLFQALPIWLLLGALLLLPVGTLVRESFRAPTEDDEAADLVVYDRAMTHYQAAVAPDAMKVYWRSCWVGVLTAAITLTVGYPVAYFIAIVARPQWRNLLLIAVAIPFWTSLVIRTSAWKLILGTGGPIDLLTRWMGGGAFDRTDTPLAVIISLVYCELPFMVLPIYASLEKLDRTLLSAAADLGASPGRAFWRVTWPLTRPGVLAGCAIVYIGSAGQYVIAELMGGNKFPLAGSWINTYFLGEAPNRPRGAAVALVVMAGMLASMVALWGIAWSLGTGLRWVGARVDEVIGAARRKPTEPAPWVTRTGQLGAAFLNRTFGLKAITWLAMLFLYVPILVLVVFSFNDGRSQAVWRGVTGKWYAAAVHNEDVARAVKHTITVAAGSTLVSTIVGTLAGLALAKRFPGRRATAGLLFVPVVIPEIVLAVALLTALSAVPWGQTVGGLVLAHATFCTSYVALVVRARLAGFDRTLEEAARDLGAGKLATFWRVKFPLILPGILAGAILALTVSVDDYLVTAYVRPAGFDTLPTYIYSKVKGGVTPEVNAVSTLMLAATIAIVLAGAWIGRDRRTA